MVLNPEMILNSAYIYDYIKRYGIRRFLAAGINVISRTIYPMQIQSWLQLQSYDNNFNYSKEDIDKNKEILSKWENEKKKHIQSMTWFIPVFGSPYAGIYNILLFIKFFLNRGINTNIVLVGNPVDTKYYIDLIRKNREFDYLKKVRIFDNSQVDKLPYTDAGIATRWDTAYSLLKYNNTKSKFYFIQDDERLHSPAGLEYILAETTYRFGFIGITNAECLKEMYVNEFGDKAESYFPTPDKKFKPKKSIFSKQIRRVFFYSRPYNPRNGFTLGMAGLKEIKKRHPEIELITAGEKIKLNDDELKIKQLGKVSLNQLPKFYANCDVGIYILFSKHTGVIPFELMASGCVVLTNKRFYEEKCLRNMENCIMFDPTPSSIADTFDKLYHNENFMRKIRTNGLEFINRMPTINEEMNKIYRFMIDAE